MSYTLKPPALVFSQTVASGTTYYTKPFSLGGGSNFSIEIEWSGAQSAPHALQLTNNRDVDLSGGSDRVRWYSDSTTLSGMSGAVTNGIVMYNIGNNAAYRGRLELRPTISGSITVRVCGNG